MRRLAEETGGSYFVVTKDLTLDTVYSRIEESLRNHTASATHRKSLLSPASTVQLY